MLQEAERGVRPGRGGAGAGGLCVGTVGLCGGFRMWGVGCRV